MLWFVAAIYMFVGAALAMAAFWSIRNRNERLQWYVVSSACFFSAGSFLMYFGIK